MADESEIIRELADMRHTLKTLCAPCDQGLLTALKKDYRRALIGAREAGISLDLLPAAIKCRERKTGLPEPLDRAKQSAFPYFLMARRSAAP